MLQPTGLMNGLFHLSIVIVYCYNHSENQMYTFLTDVGIYIRILLTGMFVWIKFCRLLRLNTRAMDFEYKT